MNSIIQPRTKISDLAQAILDHRVLDARQLTQDFWAEVPDFSQVEKPESCSLTALVVCAALVELFALRREDKSPNWTIEVGGLANPLFLVPEFERIPYQRERCLRTSPTPLKKRNLFAPDNYLSFV